MISQNAEDQQLFFNYVKHWAQGSNGRFLTGVAYCQNASEKMDVKMQRIHFVIDQCLQAHDPAHWDRKTLNKWFDCSKKMVAAFKANKIENEFGNLKPVDAYEFLGHMVQQCGRSGAYNSINALVHCANVSFCGIQCIVSCHSL